MTLQTSYHRASSGLELTAYPYGKALSEWDTWKVTLAETPASSTNYEAILDDTVDTVWRIFPGF